jgi:mRNA interferase MazF
MSAYTQKDVVLVKFPFTDLTSSKVRPAIVVSNNYINSSDDIIVVMLTTQPVDPTHCVEVNNSVVDTPFKTYTTMNANCKKIAVLHHSLIQKKITRVNNDDKFEEIISNIKSSFD